MTPIGVITMTEMRTKQLVDAEIAVEAMEDAGSFSWLKRSRTPVLSCGGAQLGRAGRVQRRARDP